MINSNMCSDFFSECLEGASLKHIFTGVQLLQTIDIGVM